MPAKTIKRPESIFFQSNNPKTNPNIRSDCHCRGALLPMTQTEASIIPITAGLTPIKMASIDGLRLIRSTNCCVNTINNAGGIKIAVAETIAPKTPATL